MTLRIPKRLREQTPSHARAKAQEKGLAKRIGGRLTPGSGNQRQKGDVRLKGVIRVECKTTKHASFSVTEEMVAKIENATNGAGEIPVIQVELGLGQKKVLVMPDWAMDLILDALND